MERVMSAKIQFIIDADGEPTHAVVPYADWLAVAGDAALSDEELFDMARAEDDGTRYPATVLDRLLDGENPVKVFRDHAGLTQKQLAEKLGVSTGYVSQVERGGRRLSRKTQALAATLLDVGMADLD